MRQRIKGGGKRGQKNARWEETKTGEIISMQYVCESKHVKVVKVYSNLNLTNVCRYSQNVTLKTQFVIRFEAQRGKTRVTLKVYKKQYNSFYVHSRGSSPPVGSPTKTEATTQHHFSCSTDSNSKFH